MKAHSFVLLRFSSYYLLFKMDESWRMRMGMPTPTLPRRRSTEHAPRRSIFAAAAAASADSEALDPEDFADVFGGPPRSVLWRKLSGDFSNTASFYEEIFRPPDFCNPAVNGGRSLLAFRIPAKSEGFYSDVFGSDDERRSRERSRPTSKAKSNSKSNSSSVLSSEELSPLRPLIVDDVALSSFTSKLRPINVPYRWNSSAMMPGLPEEDNSKKQNMPAFHCNRPSHVENHFMENDHYNDNFKSSYFGSSRRVSSPETISLEPNSYRSVKLCVDDHELNNSPSSVVSSQSREETEARSGIQEDQGPEQRELDQDEDEVMSSYVIEINSDYREGTCDAVGIDEAIAWAKEKFQKQSSEEDLSVRQQDNNDHSVELENDGDARRPNTQVFPDEQMDKHGTVQSPEEEQRKWTSEHEKQCQDRKDMEIELLDENISLWSAGKETNIRLLLSTLHYILWPTSGWYAIPLTSLIESSQVKKAYQKARLCLHPDKLQQRGATLKQKYVAEKAFSILQDAWASFISQDVFFN